MPNQMDLSSVKFRLLLKMALGDLDREWKKFGRVRTKTYLPGKNEKHFKTLKLRDTTSKLLKKFGLLSMAENRDPDYINLISDFAFKILCIKAIQKNKDCYIIARQEGDRIKMICGDKNIKGQFEIMVNTRFTDLEVA